MLAKKLQFGFNIRNLGVVNIRRDHGVNMVGHSSRRSISWSLAI
jgi:hypothetical protein